MRVCVVVTARPSWAKLAPVCEALAKRPEIELQIVACASALLERYGRVVDVIKKDFPIAAEVWSVIEGEQLITSAKETGLLLNNLPEHLSRLRPDCVVVCADRHEVLGASMAAKSLHVPLVHLQGGESSGSVDNDVRDAVTMLSDYHCVCTEQAKWRVYSLTGDMTRVFLTGCPSLDIAKRARDEAFVTVDEIGGAGASLADYREWDTFYPKAIVLQHPVTNEADESYQQMKATLKAISRIGPNLVFWPGQDAGAAGASKAIREAQDTEHTIRSLPPNRFLKLLTQASVLIGNSSAGIRECSYLGVPVVNIGSRQRNRQRAANVIDVDHDSTAIASAIERQIAHGPYKSSTLYGNGTAGEQIAAVIAGLRDGSIREGADRSQVLEIRLKG